MIELMQPAPESSLTLKQKFRLIEIAHETPHYEIRTMALELLYVAKNRLFTSAQRTET